MTCCGPGVGVFTDLPDIACPPHHYRLVIPAQQRWLTSNQRGNWLAHHGDIRLWRNSTAWWASASRLPKLDRAYICAELRFANNRRRDPANWYPTAKAAVDGLVDAAVLPDDDWTRVIGPDMRLGPTIPAPELVLHIWRI